MPIAFLALITVTIPTCLGEYALANLSVVAEVHTRPQVELVYMIPH